jgi:hypothetical protein
VILIAIRPDFTAYLRSVHSANDDTISLLKGGQRIGRGCQSRFWCGFCGKIVVLQKKGLEGANKRFDYIDWHFRCGKGIEAWSEMDGSGVKGKERRYGESESKGYYTSTALPDVQSRDTSYNTGVMHVQEDDVPCNNEIYKPKKVPEESIVDVDNWNSNFNPISILRRSSSRSTNVTRAQLV